MCAKLGTLVCAKLGTLGFLYGGESGLKKFIGNPKQCESLDLPDHSTKTKIIGVLNDNCISFLMYHGGMCGEC